MNEVILIAGSHAAPVARERKKTLHRASAIEALLQAVNENAFCVDV